MFEDHDQVLGLRNEIKDYVIKIQDQSQIVRLNYLRFKDLYESNSEL